MDGPIQKIADISIFRPNIIIDFEEENIDFSHALKRMMKHKKSNRKTIEFDNFNQLSGVEQFAVIYFLLSLFPIVSWEAFIGVIKVTFPKYNPRKIRRTLSMLIATGYARRIPDYEDYFSATREHPQLIQVNGFDIHAYRIEMSNAFRKASPKLAALSRAEFNQ